MDIRLTPEQEKWKEEVKEFLEREMTPEFLAELEKEDYPHNPISVPFSKKLAEKRWLSLTWPRKYLGLERLHLDQAIWHEQMGYYGAPAGAHMAGSSWISQGLLHHGTEEQKAQYLPPIARQEVVYCVAYTEPDAGSDLASLKTTAQRQGNEFVINGEKVFCSSIHRADKIYLAARTDPNAPKRQGISMFILDVKTPGVSYTGRKTVNHGRVNDVYFDNVHLSEKNLVGQENKGWGMLMTSLTAERTVTSSAAGSFKRLWEELVAYAREVKRDGRPIIENPVIRYKLAESAIEIEVLRSIARRVAWLMDQGKQPGSEGFSQALVSRLFEPRFSNFAMDILGFYGQLQRVSPYAPLMGKIERLYCKSCSQHGGGANPELTRNAMALRALGLPRV